MEKGGIDGSGLYIDSRDPTSWITQNKFDRVLYFSRSALKLKNGFNLSSKN